MTDASRVFPFNLVKRFSQPCALCGLDCDDRICARCIAVLPRNDCYCECCGQPLARQLARGTPCASCQRHAPVFWRARAPLRYEFPVDSALKKLKFRRQLVLAPAFAGLMLPLIEADFADCDALVPVPLHRWRHVTRGFNQADELCKTLKKQSGLPILLNVVRTRATRPQSGLSAIDRHRNINGAFQVRGDWHSDCPLIIDDVMTTGATCNALAVTLLAAGASRVGVLAVARAAHP